MGYQFVIHHEQTSLLQNIMIKVKNSLKLSTIQINLPYRDEINICSKVQSFEIELILINRWFVLPMEQNPFLFKSF